MIPPTYYEPKTPPGEKEVFRQLSTEADTDGWAVLHSLDLAEHRRQVEGEVDFVIVVPGLGVLCLEVKSHQSCSRNGGLWTLGHDHPTARSPFKQASDGMHSLREYLSQRDPGLHDVPFASAVCFSHLNFDLASPLEWCDWQVIDQRLLALRKFSQIVVSVLTGARARIAASGTGGWFQPDGGHPSPTQCDRIIELARPKFEIYESPRSRSERRTDELKRFTQDQVIALDRLAGNDRVLFEGPAGTGKTLIAIEAARRNMNAGRATGLICFNKLLGEWLAAEAPTGTGATFTGTLHSLLLDVAGNPVPANADARFFSEELPRRALDSLLASSSPARFEALVVDEAQDLLDSAYLDCLDLLLCEGLRNGRWNMFGDFTNQALFGARDRGPEALLGRSPTVARYSLTDNCRNPPRIAEAIPLLTGASRYPRVLRPDNGIEMGVHVYSESIEQADLLAEVLANLRAEQVSSRDIVILSRFSLGSAAAKLAASQRGLGLRPFRDAHPSSIRYTTIQAFKGLEAPVIVVTDVDAIGNQESDSLLYVGLSRATDRLILIANKNVGQALMRRLFMGGVK